jgi:hypothetical protein
MASFHPKDDACCAITTYTVLYNIMHCTLFSIKSKEQLILPSKIERLEVKVDRILGMNRGWHAVAALLKFPRQQKGDTVSARSMIGTHYLHTQIHVCNLLTCSSTSTTSQNHSYEMSPGSEHCCSEVRHEIHNVSAVL